MEEYRKDFEAAEKKVAGEIDPGARALVVAVGVLVLLLAMFLPISGDVTGWEALAGTEAAKAIHITVIPQIAMGAQTLTLVLSILALVTRRWALAFMSAAVAMCTIFLDLLAIWARQTADTGLPGANWGLFLGWFAIMVIAFHWSRVVWAKTALQLAAEAERREAAEAAEGEWRNV